MVKTVFVTNAEPTRDYSSAQSLGTIRHVTSGRVFDPATIVTSLVHSKLTDLLCIDGSAMISAYCLEVWLNLHGTARILFWAGFGFSPQLVERSAVRIEIEHMRDILHMEKRDG